MDETPHGSHEPNSSSMGICPHCGRLVPAYTTDGVTHFVCEPCSAVGMNHIATATTDPSPATHDVSLAPPAIEPPKTMEPPTMEPPTMEPPPVESPWHSEPPTRAAAATVRPPARPRTGLTWAHWALALLLPCTLGLAGFVALKGRELLRAATGEHRVVHPLEDLADQGLYEDFLDARQKLVIPPSDKANPPRKTTAVDPIATELPPGVPPLKLGETRKFGGLAVTPLHVRRARWHYRFRSGDRNASSTAEGLHLTLQLTNESDVIFHPNDATFNRAYSATSTYPIYTYLTVGHQRYYGPVTDPLTECLAEQNFAPLFPGDTMHTTVLAAVDAAGEASIEGALAKLPPTTPLVWRVHLRKGRQEINLVGTNRRRKVWLTTVVPVVFTPAAIRTNRPDPSRPSWFD